MKANKKFREADEAVSPVIGVILMVAITVVLAAVVFVLVSDLGGESSSAPAMSWSQSETNDRATVSAADPGTEWDEFELRADSAITFDVNGDPTSGGQDVTAGGSTQFDISALTTTSAAIGAGDYIEFCMTGSSTAAAVDLTLRHIDSNSVVKTFSFQSVQGCL